MEKQLFELREKKEILSELELYINSIKEIVSQLQQGVHIKSCRCSYFPLRATVEMALKGEIGEEFRLINRGDEDMVIELANMFINNKK